MAGTPPTIILVGSIDPPISLVLISKVISLVGTLPVFLIVQIILLVPELSKQVIEAPCVCITSNFGTLGTSKAITCVAV